MPKLEELREEMEANARFSKRKPVRKTSDDEESESDAEVVVLADEALNNSEDDRFQFDSEDEKEPEENDHFEEELEDEDGFDDEDAQSNEDEEETEDATGKRKRGKKSELKPLTPEQLKKYQERIEKTGVCYMSRIPPFMKPEKLRSMLTKYGEIGRIYLNPEDAKTAARRKKYKHNKRKNYTEGWIEFMDKKVARQVAAHLNNTNMGGKKRSYYYDDIWNIKYLPKFKWNQLTEQLAYEIKVKEQKLKAELAQVKKETKLYIKNVEKAKMVESMEKRSKEPKAPEIRRRFKQRKVTTSSTVVPDLFNN